MPQQRITKELLEQATQKRIRPGFRKPTVPSDDPVQRKIEELSKKADERQQSLRRRAPGEREERELEAVRRALRSLQGRLKTSKSPINVAPIFKKIETLLGIEHPGDPSHVPGGQGPIDPGSLVRKGETVRRRAVRKQGSMPNPLIDLESLDPESVVRKPISLKSLDPESAVRKSERKGPKN